MNMTKYRSRGFTLIEVQVALLIATVGTLLLIPSFFERAESKVADSAIHQMYTVGDASVRHSQDLGTFPDEANGCAGAIDTLIASGYLVGFQQRGGNYVTSWGSPIVTSCTALRMDVTNSAPEDRWAQKMANTLGSASITGTTVTTSFSRSTINDNQYLFRVAVPGQPERNRMETDLDMNGFDILGIETVNATTVNATTVNATDVAATTVDADTANLDTINSITIVNDGNISTDTLSVDTSVTLGADSTLTGGTNTVISNTAPGSRTETLALRWGPDVPGGLYSELESSSGGIELGGTNATSGFTQPFIDFHFSGLTEDYNSRIVADANGRLSIETSVLRVDGDVVVEGAAVADEFALAGGVNRRLGSFLGDAAIISVDPAGGVANYVPKPTCGTGLSPRIFTVPSGWAAGPVAKPIGLTDAFARDRGASWEVFLQVLTEDGLATPAPGFGRVQVITQCG